MGSSFSEKTLANLKNSVSREMREKAIGTMPEGTPFWKYSPNQAVILPKPSSFKIRKFIPALDERLPDIVSPAQITYESPKTHEHIKCSKFEKLDRSIE